MRKIFAVLAFFWLLPAVARADRYENGFWIKECDHYIGANCCRDVGLKKGNVYRCETPALPVSPCASYTGEYCCKDTKDGEALLYQCDKCNFTSLLALIAEAKEFILRPTIPIQCGDNIPTINHCEDSLGLSLRLQAALNACR